MKNPPDPSRVIEGLRDTGYTFDTAVADIVDNSITHGKAKNIWIELSLDYYGLIQFAITDACFVIRLMKSLLVRATE